MNPNLQETTDVSARFVLRDALSLHPEGDAGQVARGAAETISRVNETGGKGGRLRRRGALIGDGRWKSTAWRMSS
jgi:hypothetical protein